MTPSMAAAANSRKRRAAAATNGVDAASNGFDAYNIHGDAKAALSIFSNKAATDDNGTTPTIASKYNRVLLTHLAAAAGEPTIAPDGGGIDELSRKLQELEVEFAHKTKTEGNLLSSRKRRRNELIFCYNRALILQAQGQSGAAAEMCHEKLAEFLAPKAPRPAEELLHVTSRMAFLLLECILGLALDTTKYDSELIFSWLDKIDSEKDPQLKFLLNLYRSRFNLTELDESGKHCDNKIRAARKELKQAMDLLQNKLRTSFGADTGSVVSSANSEENNSTQSPANNTQYESQIPQGSIVLQRHNQSALSLKAHAEQLKGNTKKSLILCGEAHGASASDASYETTHANNLAVVYETNNKRHLALHALAKGLDASSRQQTDATTSTGVYFYPDGTSRPDQTLLLMHNAAICALQARRYMTSYESMAPCLVQSPVFSKQPRSWLRLAEACVGLYVTLIQSDSPQGKHFKAIMAKDEPRGVIVDNALFTDHVKIVDEVPVTVLGSPEDLAQVTRNPLIRARATLERVFHFGGALGKEEMSSAQLLMAYVQLAFQKYHEVLDLTRQVIDSKPPPLTDEVLARAYKRRTASARMYAAEANCALGQALNAMKYMVGDGQDDAFDRLALDLGGVTQELASANGAGKKRLARAQATVRASASSITATLGNLAAAKQLATSAQSMEDVYASSQERSSARRALVYVLLKSGHHGPALALLRSLR